MCAVSPTANNVAEGCQLVSPTPTAGKWPPLTFTQPFTSYFTTPYWHVHIECGDSGHCLELGVRLDLAPTTLLGQPPPPQPQPLHHGPLTFRFSLSIAPNAVVPTLYSTRTIWRSLLLSILSAYCSTREGPRVMEGMEGTRHQDGPSKQPYPRVRLVHVFDFIDLSELPFSDLLNYHPSVLVWARAQPKAPGKELGHSIAAYMLLPTQEGVTCRHFRGLEVAMLLVRALSRKQVTRSYVYVSYYCFQHSIRQRQSFTP